MNRILHTPEGVRDICFEECERKHILEQRLHDVLRSYGYRDIETPTFEYFDVFSSDIGTVPSRDLYKFFDREGNTLVLRPDFTPSIARAASRYFSDSDSPVRLCYLGSTFVNYQVHRGRLRENTQLGAELIGEKEVDADAETIAMAIEALIASGLNDFQISIGHAAFFEDLVSEAGIDTETAERLRLLIHNHNTFGAEKLINNGGVSGHVLFFDGDEDTPFKKLSGRIRTILTQLTLLNGGEEVLEKAWKMTEGLKAQQPVMRLLKIFELLKVYSLERYACFDLGMLSGYRYYTGTIFRGYTYGTGDAVVKGGRYDNLLARFGKDSPSVGFVIMIDDLMNALRRQKIGIMSEIGRVRIFYTQDKRLEAHRQARALRKEGKSVELILKSNVLENADNTQESKKVSALFPDGWGNASDEKYGKNIYLS